MAVSGSDRVSPPRFHTFTASPHVYSHSRDALFQLPHPGLAMTENYFEWTEKAIERIANRIPSPGLPVIYSF
jgi:hypothetical protein